MLSSARHKGYSLIELVVVIGIVAILFALGLPSFQQWSINSKIRNWAESIQSGLQIARSEALKRNTTIRFQLVSSLTNSCVVSNTATNWVVSTSDITSLCNPAQPAAPQMIQAAPADIGGSLVVSATDAAICFNGLGQIDRTGTCAPAPANSAVKFNIGAASGSCVSIGGNARCLQVCAGGGTIKMCDPAVTDPTDPRICANGLTGTAGAGTC